MKKIKLTKSNKTNLSYISFLADIIAPPLMLFVSTQLELLVRIPVTIIGVILLVNILVRLHVINRK